MEILFFLLIIFLIINFLVANEFYSIAEIKGYSEAKYFWISFLLGIVGYLLIIALPDKNQREVRVIMDKKVDKTSEQMMNFENDELPDL